MSFYEFKNEIRNLKMNTGTGWEEYFESFEKLGNKKCNKTQKRVPLDFSKTTRTP